VLPVFLGLATRLVEYHMADDKAYRATVCFGATSETDDRDGELVPTDGPAPKRGAVETALSGFRGHIQQRPPDYSALKVGGRRAYQLARQGTPADIPPRAVTISRLDLVEWDDSDPARPTAVLEVECGAGTYIRALARDLGVKLGCGAYLGALVRSASGPFKLAAARSLDEIRRAAAAGPEALAALLLPVDAGLDAIPETPLTAEEVAAISRGQQVKPITKPQAESGARLRFVAEDRSLIGIGSWKGGRLVPEKIFVAAPLSEAQLAARAAAAEAGGGTASQPAHDAEPRLRVVDSGNRMAVVPGVAALKPEMGRLYVAVGVFDGLHRGHMYLLRELRRAAQQVGARPAVITFDAHPEEVIDGLAPPLLCDPDERLVRLQAAGVEVTVVHHFDHATRVTPYDGFVAAIREHVDLAGFVMTTDAAFGFERGGTPERLTALGEREGFAVTIVTPFLSNGEQVRSSEIRRRISAGDLAGARSLLGRSLSLTGRARATSAAGEETGALLEFEVPVSLPPDGRYSVLVGPAWSPTRRPMPAGEPGAAAIAGGAVTLEAGSSPEAGSCVRIVFEGSAREPSAEG
jgi:tRNA pseudouridine55 synthase